MSVFTSEEAKPTHCAGFLLTYRFSVAFGLTLISACWYRSGGSKPACLDSHHLPITSYCLFPSLLSSSPFCVIHPQLKPRKWCTLKITPPSTSFGQAKQTAFTRTQLRTQCRQKWESGVDCDGGGLEEGGQWLSLAALLEHMHMKLHSGHSLAAQRSNVIQRLMTYLKYKTWGEK